VAKGVLLEDLTWVEAEGLLTSDAVVVIPLGAAAKEHGPHLKLNNDWRIAEHLKRAILDEAKVVVAPTVAHFFYPAFVNYPGSVSLSLETATNLMIDTCTSLSRFGPKRFYVLNTGLSTVKALQPAAAQLAKEGVLLRFTDYAGIVDAAARPLKEQEGGTHADEIETSMMLYIAPETVDMSKAVKDYDAQGVGPLSRTRNEGRTYSPTGIYGDPTLATIEKGERVVKSLVKGVLEDIDDLARAQLPAAGTDG
jgi:creatinine amidohydrolase